MDDTILIISGLALIAVLYIFAEGVAVHLDRRANPQREAKRPRYKPMWRLAALIGWNGPIIAAYLLGGSWTAIMVAAILVATYGGFRYLLARKPSMQRRFLTRPLPADDPPGNNRIV